MSRFDDLIHELCPDGVEFKTLGRIGRLVRGNGMPKTDFTDTGVGAIHYGQIYTHYDTAARTTISFVAPATAARLAKVDPGDLIITNTSEDVDDVCKAVAWLGTAQIVTGGHATVLKHSENPTYLAYVLQSRGFAAQKQMLATGAKVIDVSAKSLEKVRIPVPPVPVQDEIVRVLDSFHELEASLGAELEARRQQYAYYRDSLMSFRGAEDVDWAPLGAKATVVRGASPRPIQAFFTDSQDGVPWIKIGDVPPGGKYITHTAQRVTRAGADRSRMVRRGHFVLSNSMSFGRPYISRIEGAIHDGWLAISDFEGTFVSDFLYHLLRSAPIQAEFARRAGSGTVSNLNAGIVRAVRVPVPRRDEQERIVTLLDKFEVLVNDPSVGLPAEINARRAQFEYYRDKLLTFDEAAA